MLTYLREPAGPERVRVQSARWSQAIGCRPWRRSHRWEQQPRSGCGWKAAPSALGLADLWLAVRGEQPLGANGIKLMLKRRGVRAGVEGVHAHRWRHNFAHEWKLAGGDSGDLMLLLGWTSEDMPRHYGASAAAERAQQVQARLGIGERV